MARFWFVVLLALASPALLALGPVQPAELYVGEAPVDSRAAGDRTAAIRAALVQVLVRVTGSAQLYGAGPLLDNASQYAQRFRYRTQDDDTATLRVHFDAAGVNRAIRDFGLPFWAPRRPQTLTWVVGPSPSGPPALLDGATVEEMLPELERAAARRGVPLAFGSPADGLGYYDVAGDNSEAIAQVSAARGAQHVLTLVLEAQADIWRARWADLSPDRQQPVRWVSHGATIEEAINTGFGQYADALAGQYVVYATAGWTQNARLRVFGISSMDDYARTLRHIERLPLVEAVQIARVDTDELLLDVRYEGQQEDLQRAIAVAGVLREQEQAQTLGDVGGSGLTFYAQSAAQELHYRLVR